MGENRKKKREMTELSTFVAKKKKWTGALAAPLRDGRMRGRRRRGGRWER